MCGIFGYTGEKNASRVLLDGLKTLEYRGYDSAGITILSSEGTRTAKSAGEVENLESKLAELFDGANTGISHSRWATHGVPSEKNAHPHSDCSGHIHLVHNGIIENYETLKKKLIHKGHEFASDTDSEVIVHLIEEAKVRANCSLKEAVIQALGLVEGTYGIAVVDETEPKKIVSASKGSPIILGLGEGENFVTSDVSAVIRHTRDVIYLEDGEMATVEPNSYKIFNMDREPIKKEINEVEWSMEDVKKSGYEHYMLKEIMEGPEVLLSSARGRILEEEGSAKLGGLEDVADKLSNVKRVIIVGCGSAYYAGMIGKYFLEEYAGIPADVEIGSELRYRPLNLGNGSALLAVSQSGETADTLAAINEAKRKGIFTIGVVNVVGSTIARTVNAGVYNHAGPEIGVASTKAFLSQIEVFSLISLFMARQRKMSVSKGKYFASELAELPQKVEVMLQKTEEIKELAEKYASYNNFLYIGRKYQMPIAYEGALKLKEVSYIHAEGYGAGEMKHGPIAMIDEDFPTLAIALYDSVYEKMLSNIEEINARNGPIMALATEGDERILELTNDVIYLPSIPEPLSPILSVVPLQLFAYYAGIFKGYNVDKPRNLAKSVTVE